MQPGKDRGKQLPEFKLPWPWWNEVEREIKLGNGKPKKIISVRHVCL